MAPKLETDDLTRVVDGERIVDGVDLRIREGEVVAVIGSSGAGKSSFLHLLNRLDEPTAAAWISREHGDAIPGAFSASAAGYRRVRLAQRLRCPDTGLDRIKSLGIVTIPGLIIAGENPVYAAQYQFAIMLLLFAAGGLTSAASMLLVRRRVFTDAKQLDDAVLDAIDA
ncbi:MULTISPECIES: ABC transporter permease [Halostella]|uniref:ABC transporter permease n=1 Tax=Halostella TaxID=1843185 RepID=UPI002872FF1C|nr:MULTISPECIES: ABC transporter permease [Halostella]